MEHLPLPPPQEDCGPRMTDSALCNPICHKSLKDSNESTMVQDNALPHTKHMSVYTFTHTQVWSESHWGTRARLFQHRPLLTSDVVHHHSHRGVPDVAGNQAAEPLLPSGVPELQSNLQGPNRGISRVVEGVGGPDPTMLALPAPSWSWQGLRSVPK